MEYKDYIKRFAWNTRKYNQKLPLQELCQAFIKTLQTNDLHMKKFIEELAIKKNKLMALTKKDGGNLNVRDYTDDIYQSTFLNQTHFLEGKAYKGTVSAGFTNMLVVVPKAKVQHFSAEITVLMRDHYEDLDGKDVKRVAELSKSRLYELKESTSSALEDFVNHHDL